MAETITSAFKDSSDTRAGHDLLVYLLNQKLLISEDSMPTEKCEREGKRYFVTHGFTWPIGVYDGDKLSIRTLKEMDGHFHETMQPIRIEIDVLHRGKSTGQIVADARFSVKNADEIETNLACCVRSEVRRHASAIADCLHNNPSALAGHKQTGTSPVPKIPLGSP